MFPKKRKQKEKHISPPKVLKLDLKKTSPPSTPTIGPDSPIIFMPIQSNTPFSSPPPSIPPTPTGDPIISLNTHFSNSRSEVLLLQKLDMLKESMNSSKPSPPEDMFVMPSVVNWSDVPSTSKPSPPEDMFVMPSVVNWSDFPSKSVLTTEDPIDLSRLEEYANLIPSDNWQDIDAITEGAPIIDTADTTQPLAPTNIFTSVFSLEDIISSTILTTNTSLDQDTPLSPSSLIIIPKVIYTPQPTSSPIYLDVSDDDDDDDDSLLTSDGLFEIMKSLCDASNNKTPLDIKIFKPVAKNIPYLKNVTDRFNSNIYNMRGSYHNDMSLSIYIKDLKKICVRICTTLKQTYPSIYPAPQILTLIQSNRSNLACLPLLEHEEKIQELIFAFKKYINTYYRDVMKKVTISNLRLNNITKHIINVEEGYKKLYNLE